MATGVTFIVVNTVKVGMVLASTTGIISLLTWFHKSDGFIKVSKNAKDIG